MIDLEQIKNRLTELQVCGQGTGHNRFTNLRNIERLIKGEPYATFGIKGLSQLHPSEVLQNIAEITGCSSDEKVIEGTGFISPSSTLKGLMAAAKELASMLADSKVIMATGHPGSMLSFYTELARYLSVKHEILLPRMRVEVNRQRCPDCGQHDDVHWIDYIEGVATLTDGDQMLHVHNGEPMAKLLDALEEVPRLVIADHGFAGESINRGIKTITVMDTNDAAFAVAKARGKDVIIIPMDDNQGNFASGQVGQILVELVVSVKNK
ncbi:MAG: hypothetical protein C4562_04890 [Actinobacteria bacterium]|nr:MAG: hypothetical protein C4562_04890 [Actinomycetota bacterium]